jgi:hypothetical protein
MSIRRFKEIAQSQGVSVALYKAFRFGPVILISRFGRLLFNVNSKAYWSYRLLLNWGNAGGAKQTQDFAESLFINVDFEKIDLNSVLDFGCALGDSASVFRRYNNSVKIYLWDVSSIGLSKAVRRNKKYNVEKWDSKTKADFVYCSNVIEHIADTSTFLEELCAASKKWVCVQGPYQETHIDGAPISPKHPLGEHIWTIDDLFIRKFLELPVFEFTQTVIGEVPEAWPGGKQFYFVGKLR